MPTGSTRRPPERWSTVSASRASFQGSRRGTAKTIAPRRTREVPEATAPRIVMGSHVSTCDNGWPLHSEVLVSDTPSHVKKPSQPCSSAATAISTIWCAVPKLPTKPNFMRGTYAWAPTRGRSSRASRGVRDDRRMSDLLHVDGGTPLHGEITVRGAKNFVSKAMVASLLGETTSVLRNVPQIRDVAVVTGLLELHGVRVTADAAGGTLELDPSAVEQAHVADIDAHAGSSRIPILFCGPLLHRLGEAFIPDLGGCHIGDRPINYHLDILRQFGAVVEKLPNGIALRAPKGLRGAKISLPYPS